MPNDDILNTINNNVLKILEKLDNLEKRISNIEINGISKQINWINYLNANYEEEKDFNFKKFAHIDILDKEMLDLYKKHTKMNDIICDKIIRNIGNFDGIHCFSKKRKHDIFIKVNNTWRLMELDDLISIVTFTKIAFIKCTKTFPYKTRQEKELIDQLDKQISSDIPANTLTLVKKHIYNTIKE